MSNNRDQRYRIRIMVNPDTTSSWIRTLMPWAKNSESAKNKVKKFGKILSCEKFDTESFFRKIEFMNKQKGDVIVDDSYTLSRAIEFNQRVVIEDGFTLSKSMRLVKLERDSKEKKSLDEILDDDGE